MTPREAARIIPAWKGGELAMRGKFALVAFLACLLALGLAGAARAQDVYDFRPVRVVVDGREIATDVPAYIKNARTMVPLRFVAEAFGFKVVWAGEGAAYPVQIYPVLPGVNDQLQGVADDFGFYALQPGEKTMWFVARKMKDDGTVTTGELREAAWFSGDVAAEIRDGRTFVPLRMVAEAFGCRVGWDPETWTATVGRFDPAVVMNHHPVLRAHYNQDLVPGNLHARRENDELVKLAVAVLVLPGAGTPDRPMVENVPVVFYVNGREAGRAMQELASDRDFTGSIGASASIMVQWPKGEARTVKVVVDPERKHWDRNRANNVLEKTLTLD